MKIYLMLLILPALGAASPLDWSKPVHVQSKDAQIGEVDITYPQFSARVGPAAAQINAQIAAAVSKMHCDADSEAARSKDFTFEGTLTVAGLTKDFVSIVASEAYDCGGAHPGSQVETFVFNRSTGQSLDVEAELGGPVKTGTFDDKGYELYTNKITKLLSSRIPKESLDCLSDGSTGDTYSDIIGWDFAVGLKHGALVFYANPPHVVAACGFEVAVPYAEIKDLIAKGSILHAWLK